MSNYDNQKSIAEAYVTSFEFDKAADAFEKCIPLLDAPDINMSPVPKRILKNSIRERIRILRGE
ncbi:hypothetical protein POR1_45 [Pseudomonas phage POR1]|uniref:Uncharacterized protein n=1 Tax=Pseudomonas phage POR1 TaxID=1718594 RepID=A0A0N9SSG2_9CAUD|nr:hypothetical protein POR1_45 [Pseudomonas phage POR1]